MRKQLRSFIGTGIGVSNAGMRGGAGGPIPNENLVFLSEQQAAHNSTTFVDLAAGGSAPHTITANGNAKHYATPWSDVRGGLILNGSTDYCKTTDTTPSLGIGTGDCTLEAFADVAALTPGQDQYILAWGSRAASNDAVRLFGTESGGNWRLQFRADLGGVADALLMDAGASTFTTGRHHFAVVKEGSTWSLYCDGTRLVTDTGAGALPEPNTSIHIGASGDGAVKLNGMMFGYRLSDSARYSGASYTVPTTAFTDDANTLFMPAFYNELDNATTVTDLSSNAYAVTFVSGAKVFAGPYSAAGNALGSMGVYDGTGDYLTALDSPDWHFGSDNFLLVTRLKFDPTWSTANASHFLNQVVDSNNRWIFYVNSITNELVFINRNSGSGAVVQSAGLSWTVGQWYHLAASRVGNAWYVFRDGVIIGTVASDSTAVADLASTLSIGAYNEVSDPHLGWLTDTQIYKGVGISANFTPPTVPSDSTTDPTTW
jgi:hypothetical protein